MAKQIIGRGSTANDGTGDNLRDGANKVTLNFNEIYTAIGDGTNIDGTIKIADDSSTETIVSANGEVFKILGGTGITSSISGNNLTLAVDGTVLSASQVSTLTNKTINGPDNTLTNIANGSLSNSTITVTGDSGSTAIDLGDTLTVNGTANQITTAQSGDTLTLSLPSAITTPGSLTVTGNFTVQGTQTVVDSTTIEVTNSFTFEGTTSDDFETVLTVTDPTADRTVTIPDATGTIVLKDTTDTLTNKTIAAGSNTISGLVNANLSGSAGITNANLANSSLTIGDDAISLGGTQTTITNLSLDGATGTIDLTSSGNKLRFNFANTGSFPTASTYEGMFAYDIGGNNPYVADAGGWVKLITENGSIADLSNVGSIASITNGQALIWNSSAGRFDPGDAGGFSAGSDLDQAGADVQDVGYIGHRSPDATVTQTLTVTVASKTSEHTAFGDGSSNGYLIDGHEGAHVQLSPGVYKFDQADSSNSGHPLRFYDTASKTTLYSTGVTTAGTPGSSGAYTEITITKATPSTLHYQCTAHANMGGVVSVVGSEHPRITETLGLGGTLNFTGGGLNIEDGYAYGFGDNTYRIEGKDDGANARIGFVTGGSEIARFTADGLTFNGDTAAANALDDYEEGTWTPNIDTSGGTLTGDTYSVYNRGWYTRIGNTVTLSFALNLSNKGSGGSGAVRLTGFPFASTQTAASVQACVSTFNSGRTEPINIYGTWSGGYQTFRYDNATGGGELDYSVISNSFSASGQITMLI